MFGRKADQSSDDDSSTDVGAEADAVLDHALRERSVVDGDDGAVDFDDALEAVDAEDEAQQDALDGTAPATDGTDDGQDYVLYADVEPHLRELVVLQKERVRLIELLLYAADRVSSPAAADRLDDGLRRLGIESLRPDGEPFDPAHHEASATVETDDVSLHGRVAETETPGYSDNGQLVRPPIVTVYRVKGQ